jgi:hypothetical protein
VSHPPTCNEVFIKSTAVLASVASSMEWFPKSSSNVAPEDVAEFEHKVWFDTGDVPGLAEFAVGCRRVSHDIPSSVPGSSVSHHLGAAAAVVYVGANPYHAGCAGVVRRGHLDRPGTP